MKKTVTAIVNGTPVYAFEGQTLAEIANIEKPCGGHGRCGKCKVIAKKCTICCKFFHDL